MEKGKRDKTMTTESKETFSTFEEFFQAIYGVPSAHWERANTQCRKQVEMCRAGWEAGQSSLNKINTPPAAGEPVALMYKDGTVLSRADCQDEEVFRICCKVETPLYAAPPAAAHKR